MAYEVSEVLSEDSSVIEMLRTKPQSRQRQQQQHRPHDSHYRNVMGSRRIFPPSFKVKVLDSYRYDDDCKLNQRATARKFNIHRRQIQKWLQNEKTLRESCLNGVSTASSSSVAVPTASPPQDQSLLNQQYHPQSSEPTPVSPALNLSLARLHGDELAAQQQPPPSPSTAQALAIHQQQHSPQQSDYQFRVSPAAATTLAVAATGYPDFKNSLPIRQPAPDHYSTPIHQAPANYPILDVYHHQPLVYQAHQEHQALPTITQHCYEPNLGENLQRTRYHPSSHFPMTFEPKPESSSSASSPCSTSSPPLQSEDEQKRRASFISSTNIKIERASPDSLITTTVPTTSPIFSKTTQAPIPAPIPVLRPYNTQRPLKRERSDEEDNCEEHHFNGYHPKQARSDSCSPSANHVDQVLVNSLPLSPDRSSASSDSETEPQPCGNADLVRRRSYTLGFKVNVLDAFHKDNEIGQNQRATARKFGINRRQVQKWLGQEEDLRELLNMYNSGNRQRLGPVQETEESAVDMRMSLVAITDLGRISPLSHHPEPYSSKYKNAMSPSNYIDSSLTPPYSSPGCSFSCCPEVPQTYYCYSPPADLKSLKRPMRTPSCDLPLAKKVHAEVVETTQFPELDEPEQESALCLVKPKGDSTSQHKQQQPVEPVSSTVSSPLAVPVVVQPSRKKDAILFKPYLDNPVSKPCLDESANNNCQNVCNLNERSGHDLKLELSFKLPVNYRAQELQSQPSYLDVSQARSAFVRYPSSVHYS
ncbi:uncharacterized protein LOC106641017 [Copidosoma floridanum]|uniref:uncharacterized protein LOC106641017 n=1 Tax=Copidosoma floridanum TaxID=29053 RepID=UPI0006C97607|nr:uncharacterized protein LOC106641017 [Copidosoma floridanum]